MGYGKYTNQCIVCGSDFPAGTKRRKYCLKCRRNKSKNAAMQRRMEGKDIRDFESDRYLILERDEFRCVYCGASPIEDRVKLHVDHLIPKKYGGLDVASNLITSCSRCNVTKGAQILCDEIVTRIKSVIDIRNEESKILSSKPIKLDSRIVFKQQVII